MRQGGFRLDAESAADNTFTLQGDIYGADEGIPTGGVATMAGGNVLGRWSRVFSNGSDMSLQAYFDRTHLVLPTPAVAFLVGSLEADLGVMISASHNPMPDNGIKLFAAGGHKLPDGIEDEIEAGLSADAVRPTGIGVGRVHDVEDALDRYATHLLDATPHSLAGLKVVVDCANGASSAAAPEVYRRAGAEVVMIGRVGSDEAGAAYLDRLQRHGIRLEVPTSDDAPTGTAFITVDEAGENTIVVVPGAMFMSFAARRASS